MLMSSFAGGAVAVQGILKASGTMEFFQCTSREGSGRALESSRPLAWFCVLHAFQMPSGGAVNVEQDAVQERGSMRFLSCAALQGGLMSLAFTDCVI